VSRRPTVYDTTYPTYMTNCSVCHKDQSIVPATGGSALAAANAMPVTGRLLQLPWLDGEPELGLHEQQLPPRLRLAPTTCTTCHSAGNIAPATVADFHNGIETERGGIIWNGVDTSVTEGAKFTGRSPRSSTTARTC
jgi:hypothetical protein